MDKRFVFTERELRIDGLVFRLGADFAWDEWKSAPEDCFLMFKGRPLLESFDQFFSSRPSFQPQNIFEIGIWDGGSTAYWFEYFRAQKIVAVDYLDREDSEYFQRCDTIVPPGWLGGLMRHLQDLSIGVVGPVTNRIGNEAQIETPYQTYGELIEFAGARARDFRGRTFDVRMLAMFCLAMRRDVYERVGPLDERYEVGLLEDDDYAMRVHAANLRVVCAEDVFVHHFGEASFGTLVPSGEYTRVLEANRRRFEEKWGVAWQPYERRPNAAYDGLMARIRAVVDTTIPSDATVLVVSRGDEKLLELGSRRAWHFPQAKNGVYAGHYPADSAEAIAHLEGLRAKGSEFLVFPETAAWWLDHYAGFREHLESCYRVIASDNATCQIFELIKQ